MRVKELIELLKTYDPNSEIWHGYNESTETIISDVDVKEEPDTSGGRDIEDQKVIVFYNDNSPH